eukprot:TRINITY_DN17875_c0_g1_i1.p1 TRINITY_DN17875_c0_g1~~TRINITY_DN17875_c0_g1_i1.p1  ORF type:complete len:372 (+),score=53.68 TRINITY_DN17875_c0_g1_i1:107-1222(+)
MRCILILLAVFVVVLAFCVKQLWEPGHSFAYHMVLCLLRFTYPSYDVLAAKSLDEQISTMQKLRARMNNKLPDWIVGSAIAAARSGPNASRTESFRIPYGDGSDGAVPVTCACPGEASQHDKLPLVLYFHGGGMIMGSVAGELHMTQYIAKATPAVVCSVEYRLAPEHPYPAAMEDARTVGLALLSESSPVSHVLGVGVDRLRFATWGISAGGYMAAIAARQLAAANLTASVQISLVPMAKPNGGTRSMVRFWRQWSWSGPANAYAWSALLPNDDGSLAASWEVSLVVDPPPDVVARLPKAYIQINSNDVLRDEGEMYAERLRAMGKLIALDEFHTGHIGGVPGKISEGGPGEQAFEKAILILQREFGTVS